MPNHPDFSPPGFSLPGVPGPDPARRVCLAIPCNRECGHAIAGLASEAACVAHTPGLEVLVLISDTSDPATQAANARQVQHSQAESGQPLIHLTTDQQRDFLQRMLAATDLAPTLATRLQGLLLPDGISYGAATNRLFLFAASLGCESVHRRDSDSHYLQHQGQPRYPLLQELRYLGREAHHLGEEVTQVDAHLPEQECPVMLVGGSYRGETSIDIMPMYQANPALCHEILGLWTPRDMSAAEQQAFNNRMFLQRQHDPFEHDRAILTTADADERPVDMCNVSFYAIHEQVPLPTAPGTIGADYFLIDLLRALALPVVHHNRDILNYYTPERRTEAGFIDYQLRLARFFLYMSYAHEIVAQLGALPNRIISRDWQIDQAALAGLIEQAAGGCDQENADKLAVLCRALPQLGATYARAAEEIARQKARLLSQAKQDMLDFAFLVQHWPCLIRASQRTRLHAG